MRLAWPQEDQTPSRLPAAAHGPLPPGPRTCDPGSEGAAWDVLVVVLDQDAIVARQYRQVGDTARPVLVVSTADFRFGRTLDGQ